MDLLEDVLAVSGVRGAVGARIEAGGNWGWWWSSPAPRASLHAVTAGTAWLGFPEGEPLQLMPGDVVLLPSGPDHVLGSDRKAVGRARKGANDPFTYNDDGAISIGTGPVQAHILCADYRHDALVSTQILSLLPDLIHIRARNGGRPLEDTVQLLGRELAEPQLATGLVLDRLVDVLLVQVLREWLTVEAASSKPSWLGALGDPVVGAAITRIHVDPSRAWTTTSLAREVAVSRSTLSRRFTAVVGMSPRAYVVQWRMDLAAQRLRDTDDPLESVAASVGYASVYAFSRAFRAARSQPPGRYRTASRISFSSSDLSV